MSLPRFTLLAACAAFLAAPAVAPAATVELAPPDDQPYGAGWASISYRAAPGEVNRVVLTQVDDSTIRVTDTGAVIAAGEACRSLDAHSAQCSVAGRPRISGLIAAIVDAGDMDDVVDSHAQGLSADGGTGDDLLQSSGVAAGTLDGGPGRDTLLGGTNQDTLIDGDSAGADARDVMDGREGGAVVSYASRTDPVVVDLDSGTTSEDDVIHNVGGVIGGSAADALTGDGGNNRLQGGPGDDGLDGGGGDDFLEGGRGDDRIRARQGMDYVDAGPGADVASGGLGADLLDGGAGRDRLYAGAGPDVLFSGAASCGRGRDQATPAEGDYVASDCEQLRFGLHIRRDEVADSKAVHVEPYPVARRRGVLTFRLQCPYTEVDGYPLAIPLRGTLRLRAPSGRTVGAGRIVPRCDTENFEEDSSELPWLRVRVRVHGRLPRRLTVAFSGRNVPPVPWRIRLR